MRWCSGDVWSLAAWRRVHWNAPCLWTTHIRLKINETFVSKNFQFPYQECDLTYGVIRSEYSLATMSMPPALATPTELLKLPISNPTTDISFYCCCCCCCCFLNISFDLYPWSQIFVWLVKLKSKLNKNLDFVLFLNKVFHRRKKNNRRIVFVNY